MSRSVMSKMDIDVLVQLALIGPVEATDWKPLTNDPDQLGTLLWTRNFEVAGHPDEDGPLMNYSFAPLPITVTSVEGLAQCDYYRYQTMEENTDWKRGGVGGFLRRLQTALTNALPGIDAAPLGWDARALAERSDRSRPHFESDELNSPEDPRIPGWLKRWTTVGLPLVRTDTPRQPTYYNPDPRDLLASGFYRPAGQTGSAPVFVTLLTDVPAAEAYFVDSVRVRQRARHYDAHVYRWGAVVAVTAFSLDHEAHFIPAVDQCIAKLGEPDEHWWSLAPPVRELDAEVLATKVRLQTGTAGAHSESRALYARTPTELAVLVEMIEDDVLREQVASISTLEHTVLMLRGICEITAVKSVVIEQETVEVGAREPRLEHAMYLHTEGATAAIATLLVMDRLKQTPAMVILRDPDLNSNMISQTPQKRT